MREERKGVLLAVFLSHKGISCCFSAATLAASALFVKRKQLLNN
jgi:hypothetical protein